MHRSSHKFQKTRIEDEAAHCCLLLLKLVETGTTTKEKDYHLTLDQFLVALRFDDKY
jgi:hypothetical protein